MRQLDLFSPDQETFRHGYRLIECLQVGEAIEVFEGLGRRYDDVGDVVDEAVGVCRWWMAVETKVEGLEGLERAERLWACVESGLRGTAWIHLRRGVAEHLLDDLEPLGFEMASSGLCVGRLLAEVGRFRQAETWYLGALEQRPENGVLRCQYGDLLWRMNRHLEARVHFQQVLLSDPDEFSIEGLPDRELVGVIERYGIDMAPVYGWIARVLSFPEDWSGLPDSRALDILKLIEKAEDSRRRRSHDEMVTCRRKLMEVDPDVFSAYMARVG